MYDALPLVAERIEGDAEFGTVLLQSLELGARLRIERGQYRQGTRFCRSSFRGRRMIHRRHSVRGATDAKSTRAQLGECLRRRDLVHEMKVDVEHRRRGRGLGAHDMRVPQLLEQCSLSVHATSVGSASAGITDEAMARAMRSRSLTVFCSSASALSRSKILTRLTSSTLKPSCSSRRRTALRPQCLPRTSAFPS